MLLAHPGAQTIDVTGPLEAFANASHLEAGDRNRLRRGARVTPAPGRIHPEESRS